jgi:Tol biopolymer transport system component
MNGDGSGLTYLTNAAGNDDDTQWSPDGQKIGFVSSRDGNAEIYVMNRDGSGQTNLSNSPGIDNSRRWRP